MEPEDLARILDDLGQRLGPTGEYVFALAVRQVVIDASITLAWGIPTILAVTAVVVWAARFTRQRYAAAKAIEKPGGYSYERVDLMNYVMPWLMFGFIGSIVLGTAGLAVTHQLGRLLNPEYAAIRDILGAVR